jgi:UDP-N-acetylmuramoylalanine--D-glutamate ligase
MTRPKLARRDPDLRHLRVLVVGMGRSGMAAARLALGREARVLLADRRPASELEGAVIEANRLGAEVHTGGHPADLAADRDLIVVSPGVPLDHELFTEARLRDVPVWGEVELAARFCKGRVIGITGSNGKSTVTAMVGTILRGAGFAGGTGGNLDVPFCDLLRHDDPESIHAVELSSFQLEGVETFRPDVAAIVNLSPDHLDRYPSYEAYASAKARLLEVQDAEGFALLNADDPESRRFEPAVQGRLLKFSTRERARPGASLVDGRLTLDTDHGHEPLLAAEELPVPGEHNVSNALAAALACRLVDCTPEEIAEGLREYRALPHRLEFAGSVDDITFYNDSKATNLDAASRALQSFDLGRVHLILGGKDKGADWSSIEPLVRQHVRRLLLVGDATSTIEAALGSVVETVRCGTVAAAVHEAYRAARPGDVVLLSPGCASFDQYRGFEERGDDFRQAVEQLLDVGGNGHA